VGDHAGCKFRPLRFGGFSFDLPGANSLNLLLFCPDQHQYWQQCRHKPIKGEVQQLAVGFSFKSKMSSSFKSLAWNKLKESSSSLWFQRPIDFPQICSVLTSSTKKLYSTLKKRSQRCSAPSLTLTTIPWLYIYSRITPPQMPKALAFFPRVNVKISSSTPQAHLKTRSRGCSVPPF
jgi:hypothetical protein